MLRQTTIIIAALALAAPTAALADSDDLISFGVGTSVGMNNTTPLGAAAEAAFTTELNIKVKMLHFLGIEFAYSPTDSVESDAGLVFDSTFRISGLLYIVPTYPVNFYLKGGIGAGDISDLFAVDNATNSYHAGAGLDWHIGEHFVVGAEFLLLIPGVSSIKNTIESYANEEIKRFQARDRSAPYEAADESLDVSDFISADNFRVALNARYFF